jgi:hypothetical protein
MVNDERVMEWRIYKNQKCTSLKAVQPQILNGERRNEGCIIYKLVYEIKKTTPQKPLNPKF